MFILIHAIGHLQGAMINCASMVYNGVFNGSRNYASPI